MARGRQSVCLLERGKEKWPGEYPSSLRDVRKEVQVTGDFTQDGKNGGIAEGGDLTGLYHFVVGDGQNTFVGKGLGGTSLLNANVFLEMDPSVMTFDMWPEELKKKKEDWDKCISLQLHLTTSSNFTRLFSCQKHAGASYISSRLSCSPKVPTA
jgi:choline dehydrogenase-like flavoprotein